MPHKWETEEIMPPKTPQKNQSISSKSSAISKAPTRKTLVESLKIIARIFSFLSIKERWKASFAVILVIISTLSSVAGSFFVKSLIDTYIIPLKQTGIPDFSPLLTACIIMAAIYITGLSADYSYNYIMYNIVHITLKKIRDRMFTNMQRFPVSYFDTNSFGDIMSRYTNDTDTMRELLSHSIPSLIEGFFTITIVFIAMCYLNLSLTAIALVSILLSLWTGAVIASKSKGSFAAQQDSIGKLDGYIEEMMSGQKVVKVFSRENECREEFEELNNALFENSLKANRIANMMMPIIMNLGNIQYVLIAFAGGYFATHSMGGVTVGVIAGFLQLAKAFSRPISQLSQLFNSIVSALAGGERIFELIDTPFEEDKGKITLVKATEKGGKIIECDSENCFWAWKLPDSGNGTIYHKTRGEFIFDNVDFSYDRKNNVLEGISFKAASGEKLALVGATGAGKTTIANLLTRFYDVPDGKIKYDDLNINDIRKEDLRRSISLVLQDSLFFTATVKDNIRYGNECASDEDVKASAERSDADGFIRMLPLGYENVISGDASELSQGQRQLLSIARAEISDSPVMILDEATSSIDTRTEKIVQKGLERLMKSKTVFIIAHRLSTVRQADKILVMSGGKIIERGNHDELLEKKGEYFKLYNGLIELS